MVVWIVGFIVITTLLNILGIKVADKANYVLMAFQLLVLVFFVALAIGDVVSSNGGGGLASGQPFFNDTSSFATISAGAAIAAYSFLGFDAVTTLTEETINPRRTVPRAVTLVALIGGGIFVAVSYLTQLVHPGGVYEDSASGTSSIALQIGGQLFATEAARDGAALAAFPEYATDGMKKVDATFPAVAKPLDGPSAGSLPTSPAATARAGGGAWWAHRTNRQGVQHAGGVRARWRPTGFPPEDHLFEAQGFGESEFIARRVPLNGGVRARGSAVRADDLLRPAVPGAGQVPG